MTVNSREFVTDTRIRSGQGLPPEHNFPAMVSGERDTSLIQGPQPNVTAARGGDQQDMSEFLYQSIQRMEAQFSYLMSQQGQALQTPSPQPVQIQAPTAPTRQPVIARNPFDDVLTETSFPSTILQHNTPTMGFTSPHYAQTVAPLPNVPIPMSAPVPPVSNPFAQSSPRPFEQTVLKFPDLLESDNSIASSTLTHVTEPVAGAKSQFVPAVCGERVTYTTAHYPTHSPIQVTYLSRYQFARYPKAKGQRTRWVLNIAEGYKNAFTDWHISLSPGDYIFEDCGNPLVILGKQAAYGVMMFVFPVAQSTVWVPLGFSCPPTITEAAQLPQAILPSVPCRGPRNGGFLHPYCYGVPGAPANGNKGSNKQFYVASTVFAGDGQVVTESFAAAWTIGRCASFFSGLGGNALTRGFHTKREAQESFRTMSQGSTPRPALVPYISHQLAYLGTLQPDDGGPLPHKPYFRKDGTFFGKNTPMLFSLSRRDYSIRDEWSPFTPDEVDDDDEHENMEEDVADSDDDDDDDSGASKPSRSHHEDTSTVTTSTTMTWKEESERSILRLQNVDIDPLPVAGPQLALWIESVKWHLSDHLWTHEGVHVVKMETTTEATRFLSRDFLGIIKKSASKHKDPSTRANAMALLQDTIGGVNGSELISQGLGIELFQKIIVTGFHRGLGSEIIDNLKEFFDAKQKSLESVGSYFERHDQLYNRVKLMEGCDVGGTARKALLVRGLQVGSYSEVFGAWVKKLVLKQGKSSLASSTLESLKAEATNILATSVYTKNNTLLPGKNVARAATESEDSTPTSTNAELESIIPTLRAGRPLLHHQTEWIRTKYKCPVCFSHTHAWGKCRVTGEHYHPISPPDSSTSPALSQGGKSSLRPSSQRNQAARQGQDKTVTISEETNQQSGGNTATGRQATVSGEESSMPDLTDGPGSSDSEADEDSVQFIPFGYDSDPDAVDSLIPKSEKARRGTPDVGPTPQATLKPPDPPKLTMAQTIMARIGKKGSKLVQSNLKWDTSMKRDLAKLDSQPYYSSSNRSVCTDSGATSIMCPYRDMFTDFEDLSDTGQVVRLGDESRTIPILGRGTLCMMLEGKQVAYGNTLFVPDLSCILLATRVHRRIAQGCSFVADYNGCHLTYPTFSISIDDTDDCVLPCEPIRHDTKFDFDSRLYDLNARRGVTHRARRALCRMHRARLSSSHTQLDPTVFKLQKTFPTVPVYSVQNSGSKAIERISSFDMKKMFGCRSLRDWRIMEAIGQGVHVVHEAEPPLTLGDVATITRNRHGKLLERPKGALDTIGMDIQYGDGTSPGGYKYALTIVDFKTRHTWIYGLKTKSGASIIDAMWSFFIDAGGIPRRIRCDFDSAFVKGKAYAFLRRKGIKITASPPHRQSQNGAVERQWRTAVSMARALLVNARLPRRYWFWGLREAVIRMNMLPVRPAQPTPSSNTEDTSPLPATPPTCAAAAYAEARPACDQARLSRDTTDLTSPFELFYGRKPDLRTLFNWGCLGYYRRDTDSTGVRSSYDMQSSVGIALGRSNHTNGMIFWDPVTQRMNVSADYKLDDTAAIGIFFPSIVYDGHISPQVLRGGKHATKEPFPPNTTVQVRVDSDYITGTIASVPIDPDGMYHVTFPDSSDVAEVPISHIYSTDEPVFTLPSSDEDYDDSTPEPLLPTLPDWIKNDTHVVLCSDGRRRRGTLQSTDTGWLFQQATSSGRITFKQDLADLPVTWRERVTEGTLELGWQQEERAYHVSARGLKHGPPPSFQASMKPSYADHKIWEESFMEESGGLKEQDTYFSITYDEYKEKYSHVQIIPSMCVQTIKKDETGKPDRAKSRIVALGNHEDTIWEKSEKFAPVLRDESARLMTSMAVEKGRREKQGDCKNAFCQSYLPKNETIILRPPKGAPGTRNGELWVLRKTLYGLRRSPYHWYQNIKKILLGMGLEMSPHDPCAFHGSLAPGLPPVHIGLYVDDFKYFSESDESERLFEEMLSAKCRVDFMGEVSWFLGCKYEWENLPDGRLTVSVTQTAKAEELLETHGMSDCNPVKSPYRSGTVIDRIPDDGVDPDDKPALVKKYQGLVGGLLWLQRQTRPDLSTVVSLLSSYTHRPSAGHYEAGKHVLRYLKGTLDRGIRYTEGGAATTVHTSFPTEDGCYTDANWGPQDASHPQEDETVTIEETQSLLGHVVFRMGGPIIWGCTREPKSISRSSCESEIYATDEGTKSVLSVRNLMGDFKLPEVDVPTTVWNDNRGCVDWTKGVSVSKRLRHVNMRNLGVRLSQELGDVVIKHIEGKINIADLFTKEIKDQSHFTAMVDAITTPRLLAAAAA